MNNEKYYTMTSSRQSVFGATNTEPSAALAFNHNNTEFARVNADGRVDCDINKVRQYLLENPCPKPGYEMMHNMLLLVDHVYSKGHEDGSENGYDQGFSHGEEARTYYAS